MEVQRQSVKWVYFLISRERGEASEAVWWETKVFSWELP